MSATGFFSMGGAVVGSSNSNATQSASVAFNPSANGIPISSFPAGQGLSTVNDALPGSAAFLPATYGAVAGTATPTGSLSLSTLLLFAAIGAGAWLLLRKGRA